MLLSIMLKTLLAHVPIQTKAQPLICFTKLPVAFNARLAMTELEARALRVS